MFGYVTPFKSVQWNLSESSRKVMGSRWCESHDEYQRRRGEVRERIGQMRERLDQSRDRLAKLRERLQSIESSEHSPS